MYRRSAIKRDLLAADWRKEKIDWLGDPLMEMDEHIGFTALAEEVDRVAQRLASPQGGRPPFPTETMTRILVLKRLYNLSDEQMEYQLLVRMSYQFCCGLSRSFIDYQNILITSLTSVGGTYLARARPG